MASTPIYENPNGRRRRAARGSTQFRDYVKSSKTDMEKFVPGIKYNTVEQAANVTGRDVIAPWADGANFRSGIGEGRVFVDYGYDKKEIQEFIQETVRVAKEDYGLKNVNVNMVYGLDEGLDGTEGLFSWNSYNVNNNHVDLYVDTIWKNTALDNDGNLLEDGVEKFKDRIKYTIGHEMRHQWQHTTEEGKAIEEADDLYKQTKMNDYTDDFDKYYHEPVEVDARYNGEKFRKAYDLKARKYKEKLEKQGFNKEFKEKIEEINLRPKNKIIGHQFEKEPIDISSYRRFDNVEPIDWDIDTGNKSPINKRDVSKNTRYRNAKLNKGQKNLRPTVTMDGNNIEIDSIYNHAVPKKLKPKEQPYTPKIGDNIINNETMERYVLKNIDHANPDLDIHKDQYYYESPNGERITRSTPINPSESNGVYSLDDEVLTPEDVRRINNSFNDLEIETNNLNQAKTRLSELQEAYKNGADNLDEIYETTKAIRSMEQKLGRTRMQIEEDNARYNTKGNWAYDINEKTQKYIDEADSLLGDYSETKYMNDYEEIFKENMPRQTIDTIEPGFDNAIQVTSKNTVNSNIKKRKRGIQGTGQATGRGNRKINKTPNVRSVPKGSGTTSTIKTGRRKIKKSGTVGRGGKATKLKPVGKNGKALSVIPRKVPLTKKQLVKQAANLVVNSAATNTANTIIKNVQPPNVPNVPHAPNVPNNPASATTNTTPTPGPSSTQNTGSGNTPNTPSNNFSPNYDPNDPITWTDADIDEMAEGDPYYFDELQRRRQEAINGKTNTPGPNPGNTIDDAADAADDASALGKLSKMDIAMTGLNIVGAIGDYKEARRRGHGVVSSATRAGVKFAVDEALGWWALPIGLAKTVPGAIIKGADILHKENRRMNSAANFQAFGDAQFMDTQQLATMRQSGMEMAKMSQYNLQQTLMGNEATYLHR